MRPEWMTQLWLRAKALWRRGRLNRDLEDEMQFHLDMRAAKYAAEGMEPSEARLTARRVLGNPTALKEACRGLWTFASLEGLWRDLRYAGRILRKSPGFTIVAVATLALGIGANTAVFSVVDAVLLRPLPYPAPDRLGAVAFEYRGPEGQGLSIAQDGRTWEIVRDGAAGFDCAVFSDWPVKINLAAPHHVEYVTQQRVSAGFFRVMGVPPRFGREFTREEDRAGGPPVAVLSYGLWQRVFAGDRAVLGHTVSLRGEPHTIVGILPPGFRTNLLADVWTPLKPSTAGEGGGTNYGIVARLAPGVTWAQAEARVANIGAERVKSMRIGKGASVRFLLVSLQSALAESTRTPVLILWIAVALVLLIGCVNIAGLLLARAAVRTREIATRLALGGGRAVVLRQLLAESLLLSAMGGVAGIAVGLGGIEELKLLGRNSLQLWQTVGLDTRVLLATMCIAVLTSLLFGLYPAWRSSRMDIRTALVEGGGRGVAGFRSRWPRRILVTGEVALGFVLLIGAGLMIRTFLYLNHLPAGFDPNNVVTATLSLQDARYQTRGQVNRLFDKTLERIREIPGVEAAAVSLSLPYERGLNNGFRLVAESAAESPMQMTVLTYVTPDYFRALRIPLLAGRAFRDTDGPQTAQVVVVNQAFVAKYLRGRAALNSQVRMGNQVLEIVGIAGDVPVKGSLNGYGPMAPLPMTYIPAAQASDRLLKLVHVWFSPSWIVRTARPSGDIAAAMQGAMASVDPLLPFSEFRGLDAVKAQTLAPQRFEAVLMGTLAGLALLLSAIGIYGLIANSVAERTRELGIRIALGAGAMQAVRSAALPGLALSLAGCGLGALLAAGSASVLRHLIWGVTATDPGTFAGAALGLLLVAGLSSLVPALRIVGLNPADTLRNE